MTQEEVVAWRAQIDLATDQDELIRILQALRNVDPALFILIQAAQNKREDIRSGRNSTEPFLHQLYRRGTTKF